MIRLLLFALSSLPLLLHAARTPLKADISAKAAIVMNAETGAVLYEKSAHTPLFPASITKIVTALYAIERKGDTLDELVTASHDAVAAVHPSIRRAPEKGHPPYRLEFGGTHMGIKAGEELSLRTLIYGLMLSSGNDAANVIAEHVSGSGTKFIEEVNAYMRGLGCKNTVFHTPHGLPHLEHKTTAYDMALITKEALKFPFFREVVKTLKMARGETNKQPDSDLFQHNALLKPGRFYYPKAIGVKTGYTLSGGYTLVAAAEDENRKLITVLLGCQQLAMRYQDAITLFDAAFHEPKVVRTLFSKQFDHFSCTLPGARSTLVADLLNDVRFSYYASEEPEFAVDIVWEPPVFPILANHRVGEVRVVDSHGNLLEGEPLFSTQRVDPTLSFQIQIVWNECKQVCTRFLPLILAGIGFLLCAFAFYLARHRSKHYARKRSNSLRN